MMMTARDSIMDIVAGLDRGADDYIVKPLRLKNYWHVFVQPSVAKISKPLRMPSAKASTYRI